MDNFNPRTSVRYDTVVQRPHNVGRFQSTYLCEVRPVEARYWTVQNDFNPRTSVRYDSPQHTGTPGKTNFNPRTSVRYDPVFPDICFDYRNFNPRTSVRYDRYTSALSAAASFQSTYLCEVRPAVSTAFKGVFIISIHVPL